MPGRNLVICFDGTNNQFGPEDTNVVRLVRVLDRTPSKQRLYYDPGVGTLAEPGVLLPIGKKISELFGLAFGLGFARKIQDAYAYLMEYWEPGDTVYLFGFSRGAYAARVLAGMLYAVGLLPRGAHNLLPYAFKYFRSISEHRHVADKAQDDSKWKKLCADFAFTLSRKINEADSSRSFPVHFVGVWDTVSSVGWVWDPKHFPYTAWNPAISHIRHAVSLDERRAFFRQNLFSTAEGQDLVELWFPGVHSDVGGGYRQEDGKSWRPSFLWMLEEARAHGLQVDDARLKIVLSDGSGDPSLEPLHESLTAAWMIGEIWPKLSWDPKLHRRLPRLNLGRRRYVHPGATLADATLDRLRSADAHYRPSNLPEGTPT